MFGRQHYGFDHIFDGSRQAVVLFKNAQCRMYVKEVHCPPCSLIALSCSPSVRMSDLGQPVERVEVTQKRIMKRPKSAKQRKERRKVEDKPKAEPTLEEREAAYQRARARIFSKSTSSTPGADAQSVESSEPPPETKKSVSATRTSQSTASGAYATAGMTFADADADPRWSRNAPLVRGRGTRIGVGAGVGVEPRGLGIGTGVGTPAYGQAGMYPGVSGVMGWPGMPSVGDGVSGGWGYSGVMGGAHGPQGTAGSRGNGLQTEANGQSYLRSVNVDSTSVGMPRKDRFDSALISPMSLTGENRSWHPHGGSARWRMQEYDGCGQVPT